MPGKSSTPRVAPCMQGDQIHMPSRRLVERDRGGQLRDRRAVDADEDRRLRGVRHQRVFVVDDRDRAMCMLNQPGTHRAEQSCRTRLGRGYRPPSSRRPSTCRRAWERRPSNTSRSSTLTGPVRFVASLATLTASSMNLRPRSCCHFPKPVGSGVRDQGHGAVGDMDKGERHIAHRGISCGPVNGDSSKPQIRQRRLRFRDARSNWTYLDGRAGKDLGRESLVPNGRAIGPIAEGGWAPREHQIRGTKAPTGSCFSAPAGAPAQLV